MRDEVRGRGVRRNGVRRDKKSEKQIERERKLDKTRKKYLKRGDKTKKVDFSKRKK